MKLFRVLDRSNQRRKSMPDQRWRQMSGISGKRTTKIFAPLLALLLLSLATTEFVLGESDDHQLSCNSLGEALNLKLVDLKNVKTKPELQRVVAAMVDIPVGKYSGDLLTSDPLNAVVAPISMRPNKSCTGLISMAHLTVNRDVNKEKLSAMARLMGGPRGLDPSVAESICSEPRLTWMKNLNYNHRYIVTTPDGVILNDFLYDYSACTKYLSLMKDYP